MMGLPTEHCKLNEHLYVVGSPGRHRWKKALETASHILYGYEALVVLRFSHLRHHFLEPGDCTDISHSIIFRVQGCWSAHPNEFYSLLFYYVYALVVLRQPNQYRHRNLFFNTFLFIYWEMRWKLTNAQESLPSGFRWYSIIKMIMRFNQKTYTNE